MNKTRTYASDFIDLQKCKTKKKNAISSFVAGSWGDKRSIRLKIYLVGDQFGVEFETLGDAQLVESGVEFLHFWLGPHGEALVY